MAKLSKKDAQMAAANDRPEADAPATTIGSVVPKVVDGIKDAAKKAKKRPSVVETDEKRVVQVRYKFTTQEKAAIAQTLAQRQMELVEVEDEKKSVMASFTDRLKAKKIDIGKMSRQVRDGWENRDHNTTLILDFKKREKRYRDVETKKIVKVETFGPGDDQRRFV